MTGLHLPGNPARARVWIRSVVDVITTRTPAWCNGRATAKPIPWVLPAPVISAVCLFSGKTIEEPMERMIHGLTAAQFSNAWPFLSHAC